MYSLKTEFDEIDGRKTAVGQASLQFLNGHLEEIQTLQKLDLKLLRYMLL